MMHEQPRTLTGAVEAIKRHVDNGRSVNVDQAATRAIEQHAKGDSPSYPPSGGTQAEQG